MASFLLSFPPGIKMLLRIPVFSSAWISSSGIDVVLLKAMAGVVHVGIAHDRGSVFSSAIPKQIDSVL